MVEDRRRARWVALWSIFPGTYLLGICIKDDNLVVYDFKVEAYADLMTDNRTESRGIIHK